MINQKINKRIIEEEGRDCMKRFCTDLKGHVTRITNYEMKPMNPLTEDKKNHMKIKSSVIYVKKNFLLIIIKKK